MLTWVLFLALTTGPKAVMVPVESYNTKAECLYARKLEIDANIKAGLGGGATYVCLEN